MDLKARLDVWARRALALGSLTELDLWDAFEHRQALAAALAAGATLPAHLDAVLAAADDLWIDNRRLVEPLLRLGTYLASRPAGHWALTYLQEQL